MNPKLVLKSEKNTSPEILPWLLLFAHLSNVYPAQKNWCLWTVVLEKTLESPLDCKEIQPVHPKGDQPWVIIGRTDAEGGTPIFWPPDGKNWLIEKDPDAGKKLKVGGERDDRGWDGWMASLSQWTWVWVNSGSWWWTGSPGVLQSMGSQRVGHDWATELNWTKCLSQGQALFSAAGGPPASGTDKPWLLWDRRVLAGVGRGKGTDTLQQTQ